MDIRSAGKSITALLVGVVVDRGAIRSSDDPVAGYWTAGAAIGDAPLRDVLTMRSGLIARLRAEADRLQRRIEVV